MRALPAKWIKRIAVLLGAAGMLTPALIELGWIPEHQALKAVIFLLGFIVLEGAARESNELVPCPEFFTTGPEDFFHAASGLFSEAKHEILAVIPPGAAPGAGKDARGQEQGRFMEKAFSTLRREKQLHMYVVLVERIGKLNEEYFQWRLALERDPALEGRLHYRVVDSPAGFGCAVYDQKDWMLDFLTNPAGGRGVGVIFKNHPEVARLVAGFIHHQWLEPPGVTMSLGEAYEKWKAIRDSSPTGGKKLGKQHT